MRLAKPFVNRFLVVIIAIGLAWSLRSEAQVEFGGYFKSYIITQDPPAIQPSPPGYGRELGLQSLSAGRLNVTWTLQSDLSVEAAYEATPIIEDRSILNQSVGSLIITEPLNRGPNYRLMDIKTDPVNESGHRVFQNLDRLSLHAALPFGDLTVGRQAITFGTARVISPTDVLLPYSFAQLNVEYRMGIDGLRLQAPIGATGELDIGAVVGEEARAENNAAFIRSRLSYWQSDFVVMAMTFARATLIGGGIQTGIQDFGYTLDFAQIWPDSNDEAYFRLSMALDHTLASELFIFVEYHFNGAGSSRSEDYLARLQTFAYQKGGVFLLGRHYLIPGASYPLTPLTQVSGQALWNLEDGSVFLRPSLEYNFAENIYFDFGSFLALGQGPQYGTNGVKTRSEFGSYPIQAYAALRFYF